MLILFRNTLKMLLVGIVISTMFIVTLSEAFSLPTIIAWCEKPPKKTKSCGSCWGVAPSGSGKIICQKTGDGVIIDAGLDMGFTSNLLSYEQKTSIFVPDADTLPKIGRGFIGALVTYNFYSQYLNENVDAYTLCNAIEFDDYDEWLAAALFIYDTNNYVDGKVLVYPNPTSHTAFVKLQDDYINTNNVQSVSYNLFDNNQAIITTFTPNNIEDIVIIPDNYINLNGTYYIKCNVSYLLPNNQLSTEIITLSFIVSK